MSEPFPLPVSSDVRYPFTAHEVAWVLDALVRRSGPLLVAECRVDQCRHAHRGTDDQPAWCRAWWQTFERCLDGLSLVLDETTARPDCLWFRRKEAYS